MKERPILFSGCLIPALLNGSKTQTRRIAKHIVGPDGIPVHHPFGEIGDRLWVKETWWSPKSGAATRADVKYRADDDGCFHKWYPSIFMPRRISRIILEISQVRRERLQDITEEDAIAEGYPGRHETWPCLPPIAWYRRTWDSLNAKRGYGWDANPWVWVISFRRLP